MSKQKRDKLITLLLLNSKVKLGLNASGYFATCYTQPGTDYMVSLFENKSKINIRKNFSVPLLLEVTSQINYFAQKNPAILTLIKQFELE
tara:strand:+ start:2863 stop:3132 length:270 start_codon:yes stop_codon:yes gene_type:complete